MGTIGDEFLSRQRVLVISPHADDETYGCAGTIARIKDLGGQVYVSLISVGSVGPLCGQLRRIRDAQGDQHDAPARVLRGDEAAEGRRLGGGLHRRRGSPGAGYRAPQRVGKAHRAGRPSVDRKRSSRR